MLAFNTWKPPPLHIDGFSLFVHAGRGDPFDETVALIDVLWLDPAGLRVVCAFEVEKSTSIYSGILRLLDLHRSAAIGPDRLYLVAPDVREREIQAQLGRPSFADTGMPDIHYILFSDLGTHCDGLCLFGVDHLALTKIARRRPS